MHPRIQHQRIASIVSSTFRYIRVHRRNSPRIAFVSVCRNDNNSVAEVGSIRLGNRLGLRSSSVSSIAVSSIAHHSIGITRDGHCYYSVCSHSGSNKSAELEELYERGLRFYKGEADNSQPRDYRQAVLCFSQIIAEASNDEKLSLSSVYKLALTRLALMYLAGYGVPRSLNYAAQLLQKSADLEEPEAQTHLALMHQLGMGVSKDVRTAIEWYKRAATNGNSRAQFEYASLLLKGDGVERDVPKAMYFLKQASDNDYEKAQLLYGELLLAQKDKSETTNIEPALLVLSDNAWEYIEKAAENGNAEAERKMGDNCRLQLSENTKRLTRKDALEHAVFWYKRASHQGDTKAQASLGILHYHGIGCPRDVGLSLTWLTPAAEANQIDAIIQLAYAVLDRSDRSMDQMDSKSKEVLQEYIVRINAYVEMTMSLLPIGSTQAVKSLSSDPAQIYDWLESYRYHYNEPWLGGFDVLLSHVVVRSQIGR